MAKYLSRNLRIIENTKKLKESVERDRLVRIVSKEFDSMFLEFVKSNINIISRQADEDKDYISGVSDCPIIPVFDQYLANLEGKLKNYLVTNNYPESLSSDVIRDYHARFYHSVLPNIPEPAYTH